MATAYIAKIPEFTGKNNNTSPQEWLDKIQKTGDANGWNVARMLKAIPYFFQETAKKWILNQFIAELKDKLIKKVHPHVSEDLAIAIRHAKNHEMAIKEANYTKFVNLTIGKTSSAAEKKIDQLTKKLQRDQQNKNNQHYFSTQQFHYHPLLPNNYYQSAPQQQYQQSLLIQQYQYLSTQQYQVPA
ncbi:hypothetical protein G9A89_014205 [Geosiphon pyriformis]|nr:hypothetical protein G9A89_014205 [Geosiphon pyriformis]